ncbi:MAG: putative glycolipid-binding domain-containing protein [Streptosporangiaceae bacterium]
MSFDAPPTAAAWLHRGARLGYEVVFFHDADDGLRIEGCTTATEDGQMWAVSFVINTDATWTTRSAQITGRSASGSRQITLEADGDGHWLVGGETASSLDGCLDVDLESSAMTNALPIHRMGLTVGSQASAPAVYIRAVDLAVERLEQHYTRVPDKAPRQCYDYASPTFDYAGRLSFDKHGLALDYPGIAVRAG